MAIIRSEIPILEFDTDETSVLSPGHERLDLKLPRKAVFAFLGNVVDDYAKENGGYIAGEFISVVRTCPVYIVNYNGEDVCLMQAPVGAAAAVQILDWLIAYGVREIISAGTCGALEEIPENTFLVPRRALRDEGASYHYAPPSRFIHTNARARSAIERALELHGIDYREVVTWTTDGIYRETAGKTAYRKSEGCNVVEMECSALAACAEMRGAVWGELLFAADSLADSDGHDARNWGKASFERALRICLDAVLEI